MEIQYFFSTISPFAYLAGTRLEDVARRHGATIRYRPLDIVELFARTGGTLPKDRHPSRQKYRTVELARQSRKHGLPLNLAPAHFPANQAPASYAIIAAQAEGGDGGDMGALAHGILRSVWAEDLDIGDEAVVRNCLSAAGFDPEFAGRGLADGADAYSRNLDDAVEAGAFGSPFYVAPDGEGFWGQDRIEDLDAHLSGS